MKIAEMKENELRDNINSFNKEQLEEMVVTANLSDKFMRDNIDVFDQNDLWSLLSKYQLFTLSFLNEYCMKIDWSVAQSKRLSCEMLDNIKNLPIRKKILVKIEGNLDAFSDEQLQLLWDGIKYNEECTKTGKEHIDIMQYANPALSIEEMTAIKNNLIDNSKEKNLTIDDLINGKTIEDVDEEIEPKKKERNLKTRFGEIKLIAKDTYEYPMKEKKSFEDSDNEFGDFMVFDE